MADNFSPFNNQPADTVISSGSYTIPAGQYARVTFFMQASMIPSIDNNSSSPLTSPTMDGSSENKEITLWLKSGDAITTNTVNGSTSLTTSGGSQRINSLISTSISSFLINTNVFELKSSGSVTSFAQGSQTETLRLTGSASIQYHVELYNNQGS